MGRIVLFTGGTAAAIAVFTHTGDATAAASRTWPPFVLVVGLLLIGEVAQRDGLFESSAAMAGRLGGPAAVLFVALLGIIAVTTAVLNLDTAVAFLTPVVVLTARRRGLREEPFLYGALFMANSASLLLPGSNLTNLLVLAGEHASGALFAARMAPAWVAAVASTVAVLLWWFRRELATSGSRSSDLAPAMSGRAGLVATLGAATLVVGLSSPAIAVLLVGIGSVAIETARKRLTLRDAASAVDLPTLAGLFGVAVALGTLAATWSGPAQLMREVNAWETVAIAAVVSVAVNNLPAAVMLSSQMPSHPRALLIGLNLGPNLAVTGSLSALLWFKAAVSTGARPSVVRVSVIGAVLVPCTLIAAMAALAVFAPAGM